MPMEEDSTERNLEAQELDDTQRVYSDFESHEFVDGIMKIVPPDLDVSPNCFPCFKIFQSQFRNFIKQHIARNSNQQISYIENYARLNSLFNCMLHYVQMDVDYWFRSEVGEVSITDLWPNECILRFLSLSLL